MLDFQSLLDPPLSFSPSPGSSLRYNSYKTAQGNLLKRKPVRLSEACQPIKSREAEDKNKYRRFAHIWKPLRYHSRANVWETPQKQGSGRYGSATLLLGAFKGRVAASIAAPYKRLEYKVR
jgi:hypothetical protein